MKLKRNTLVSHSDLPVVAIEYLAAAEKKLALATCIRHRTTLMRLHSWMKKKGIQVGELTPELLIEHRRWCGTLVQASTADVEYYNARTYAIWLIRSGHLKANATDFFKNSLKPADLPDFTELFLKHRKAVTKYGHVRYRQLLNLFHNWLLDRKTDVSSLSRDEALCFLSFLSARGYTSKELHIRRLYIRIYFDWLRDRDLTRIDCRDVFKTVEQYRNYDLPDFADEYLQELQITLRDDTVKSYKTNLMGLHRFLHREDVAIQDLDRITCVNWMKFMFEKKKFSASTRLQRLVNTRGYLYWLADRGILKADVDQLINSSDFPKLDLVLPKPLPPDVDSEIQRRLLASTNIYHQGALLLRLTGMRLGELSNLNFNPIWRDDSGKTYIKVPIGKLHSERLVPIDEKAITLIESMQRGSLPHLRRYSKNPESGKLLLGPKGGSALHNVYRLFKMITAGISGCGSIHPHRLRHTFATTLMNADLNPWIIMTLLGHKSLQMTFRYSLITDNTIYNSYFKAVEHSTLNGFKLPEPPASNAREFDPLQSLEDVAKWVKRERIDNRATELIVKRINRLRSEIDDLQKN